MNALFAITSDDLSVDELCMNPNYPGRGLGELPVPDDQGRILLRFGVRSIRVRLSYGAAIGRTELRLSRPLIEQLTLPLCCRFELLFGENEITVGPFIGILAEPAREKLLARFKLLGSPFSAYMDHYEQVGGAVLVFSLDDINSEEQRITGFLFNPSTGEWERGSFRYPASLFNRITLNRHWREHLSHRLGDRVFNSRRLDKWQMHRRLNACLQIAKFLPVTLPYNKPEDIDQFSSRYPVMYIKPSSGSLGRDILFVSKEQGKLMIRSSNKLGETLQVGMGQPSRDFWERRLGQGRYVLQQAIEIWTVDGRPVDFRCIVVKNERGIWEQLGLIARYGKPGSIVSNILAGGSARMAGPAIREMVKGTCLDAEVLQEQMSGLAMRTAAWLDQGNGHYGNLGIDLAVDRNGTIWILEVNNRNPDHSIARDAGEEELYRRCLLLNMLYAKRLAGFTSEG